MINTDSIEITPMTMKDSDTFSFFNYWGKCGPVTLVEKIILIGIRHVHYIILYFQICLLTDIGIL